MRYSRSMTSAGEAKVVVLDRVYRLSNLHPGLIAIAVKKFKELMAKEGVFQAQKDQCVVEFDGNRIALSYKTEINDDGEKIIGITFARYSNRRNRRK